MHSVLENGQHVGQNRFMGKKDACMIEVYHHKGRLSLSLSLSSKLVIFSSNHATCHSYIGLDTLKPQVGIAF